MKLSRKLIKILGFSLIGILLLGGFFGVGKPLLDKTKENASEIADTQTKNDGLQSSLGQLQSVKTNVAAIDTINAKLLKQFPELVNVPDLLNTIGNAASSAGIAPEKITQIDFGTPTIAAAPDPAAASGTTSTPSSTATPTPSASSSATPAPAATSGAATTPAAGTAAPTSKLATMTVGITVSGTPRQFQTFLSGLSSMDRAFTVSTFSIAVGGANAAGGSTDSTLTLSGDTFIYSHVTTPDEAQSNAATNSTGSASDTTTNPSSPATASPSN